MILHIEIDSINTLSMQCLHFDFHSEFGEIVSSDWSILKYNP